MLIDHNNVVQKTNLRKNLAEIFSRVYKGDTIYITDRGSIMVKISSVGNNEKRTKKITDIISQQNEIRKQLTSSKFAKINTTQFIRDERKKRSDYLFDRESKNV